MKKFIFLAALLFVAKISSGRELTANLTWCAFSTPENKNYVETYLSVIGNSVNYAKNKNGKFQASVDVMMTFTQDDSTRFGQRYILNSPELDDSTKTSNFLDLQRIPLPTGYYTLSIALTDLNRVPQRTIMNRKNVLVDIDQDSVTVSHLEFLESYSNTTSENTLSKSGYDLVPYVSAFLPENMTQLNFYGEIYNTKKVLAADPKFLVLLYVESSVTNKKMQDFNAFLKPVPQKIVPLIYNFNIQNLPSGNYNLVVEVRNASNRLLALRKAPFERFNPGFTYKLDDLAAIDINNTFVGKYNNIDTLTDMIRSLRPISSTSEVEYAENRLKAGDVKLMQQYFYNFWMARNETNPEAAWLKYNEEVQKVNKEFGTQIIKGYDTDRGRVYLQYGPPDQRVVTLTEPSSYPYEIWQYYTIKPNPNLSVLNQPNVTSQTNKKFVFADFDLVTNNYQLIHSDARGEVRDDNWQMRLVKRDTPNHNIDQQQGDPQYGGHSTDWYNDPH
jgi:GWxTD domain-containing protein